MISEWERKWNKRPNTQEDTQAAPAPPPPPKNPFQLLEEAQRRGVQLGAWESPTATSSQADEHTVARR